MTGPVDASPDHHVIIVGAGFGGIGDARAPGGARHRRHGRHFPLSHYRYATPVREPALADAGALTDA